VCKAVCSVWQCSAPSGGVGSQGAVRVGACSKVVVVGAVAGQVQRVRVRESFGVKFFQPNSVAVVTVVAALNIRTSRQLPSLELYR